MSLHDMVSNVISSVNPMMKCSWLKSLGNTVVAGGKMTPYFAPSVKVQVQVKQLTFKDLQHLSDLNMQGITRKVWCDAILSGVDRAAQTGGDKLYLPDGTAWLVVAVPEVWPDWCTALIQKQLS